MFQPTRLAVILDYLADHGYDGVLSEDSTSIRVKSYPGMPLRTGMIPVSYTDAKLFVERKPPYAD